MRAITVMYDSLNRKYLPNYGDNLSIMPNFRRLRKKQLHLIIFMLEVFPAYLHGENFTQEDTIFYIDVGDRWNLLTILLRPYWEKTEYILIA